MSDDDDILAIVAALEFLSSRDQVPPPRSKWKESTRDAVILSLSKDDAKKTTWKNS